MFLVKRKCSGHDGNANKGDAEVQVVGGRGFEGRRPERVSHETEDGPGPQQHREPAEQTVSQVPPFWSLFRILEFVVANIFPALLCGLRGHSFVDAGVVAIAESLEVDIVSVEVDFFFQPVKVGN